MSIYNKNVNSNNGFARDFSKGKSFDFSEWNPVRTYLNDPFKQDFVKHNGCIYVCMHSNTNVVPGTSDCWLLALDTITGTAFIPIIDDSGNLSWELYNGVDIPGSFNIKGEQGVPGKDAPIPIFEIDEKGHLNVMIDKISTDLGKVVGAGNQVSFGESDPRIEGLIGNFGDIYVNLLTGDVFEYISEWILKGSIQTSNNPNATLDWIDIGF